MKVKKVKALVTSDFLQPHGLVAHQASLFVEFSRQEYWSGSHSLLQGIFLTQGLNLCLLHCRQILYHLSHQVVILTRNKVGTIILTRGRIEMLANI